MENLTLMHQVMKPATADPQEGHTVVVFETVGESGESFRYEIPPGGKGPRKSLMDHMPWRATPNYWAYAVTSATSLRVQFTQDITMDDHLSTFTLFIDLTYSVSTPRILVTRRNEDPLKRVREEIVSLANRELISRDWDEIVDDFRQVERDVVNQIREPLSHFASGYGISIHDIALTHRIPRDSNKRNIVRRKKEDLVLEAEIVTTEKTLEHEHTLHTTRNDDAQRRLDAKLTAERNELEGRVAAYARLSRVADAAEKAISSALINSAAAIQSPAELLQAMTSLTSAVDQMRSMGSNFAPALAGATALPQLTAGQQSGLGPVLLEMMTKTEPMSCTIATKKRLRAAMLRLLSELLPEETPNAEVVQSARDRVVAASAEVSLRADQADYIQVFTNTKALREQLL